MLSSQAVQEATEATPLLQREDGSEDDLLVFKKEDKTSHEIFWEELHILPQYVLPVLGSQLLEYSMVVVNVISVGHISTEALAAISLGTMTAAVTGLSLLNGLSTALETVLPAAFTSSQPQLVGLWAQRMAVVMACALVPIALIWLNAEPIFLALKQDPEVARLAALYLRCMMLALPALAWNIISRRYFQSQRLFYVQTRIIFFVAPLNAIGNYLLVWGPEAIRLGFIGAPIATTASFYLIAIISYIHGAYLLPRTAWHPLSMKMFSDLGLLVRLGLSGVALATMQYWAWEFATLAASYMGPTSLAAHSILTTTSACTFQLHFSNVSAAAIRVGNLLGERNAVRAGISSKAGLVLALLTAFFTCTVLLVSRNFWPRLFNDDPAVILLVSRILPLVAMYQFVDGTAVMTAGFLRVRGEQLLGAMMNLSAYFILGLPMGLLLAFKLNMDLLGLWIGMAAALVYTCVFGVIFWFRTDWKEEVRKAAERNAREGLLQKALA